MSWIVIQLGAREAYSIARSLHQGGQLKQLITDRWHPNPPLSSRILGAKYAEKSAGRYSRELEDANVVSFNQSALIFELKQKFLGTTGWAQIMKRNDWFQDRVVGWLKNRLKPEHTVFSYSYAAKRVFELCKEIGCKTVLGQIDPGIREEDLVADEVKKFPDIETGFRRAPAQYWDQWRQECELADMIMVNSDWSRDCLQESSVDSKKIEVVPLVYGAENSSENFERSFASGFDEDRKLQILYLGQVIPRKGIQYVLGAAELLKNRPVEFVIVGDPGPWQELLSAKDNIKVVGSVPRNRVNEYYQQADVFLFPTVSDGFGLTQLEAQRWGLPLICSRNCGEVLLADQNGLLLANLSDVDIARSIEKILNNPYLLNEWTGNSSRWAFGFEELRNSLLSMGS